MLLETPATGSSFRVWTPDECDNPLQVCEQCANSDAHVHGHLELRHHSGRSFAQVAFCPETGQPDSASRLPCSVRDVRRAGECHDQREAD